MFWLHVICLLKITVFAIDLKWYPANESVITLPHSKKLLQRLQSLCTLKNNNKPLFHQNDFPEEDLPVLCDLLENHKFVDEKPEKDKSLYLCNGF